MFQYVAIFVMMIIAAAIGVIIIGISHLLGQITKSKVKLSPYECGTTTIGSTRRMLNIRYYIVAMLFLIFDIETVFLYPWAVITKRLGLFGFVEMIIFVFILLVGYVYIWKKGALEWE
jgi:NADH-quinone oxidoreductase subunit A